MIMPMNRAGGNDILKTFNFLRVVSDSATRRRVFATLTVVAAGSAVGVTAPWLFKLLVDGLGQTKPQHDSYIFLIAALYAGAQYGEKVLVGLRSYYFDTGAQRLKRLINEVVFDHLLRLPVSYHIQRQVGAVVEALNQGLGGIQSILQHALVTLLPVVLEFTSVVVILICTGHGAFLLILLPAGALYAYAFWDAIVKMSASSRDSVETNLKSQGALADGLTNFETVKFLQAEGPVLARYGETLIARERAWCGLSALRRRNVVVIAGVFALTVALTVFNAAHEVLTGGMTVGDFVLILSYTMRLMLPLEAIGVAVRDCVQGLLLTRTMLSILEDPPEAVQLQRVFPAAAQSCKGEITFDNVSFSYDGHRPVLKHISFTLASGRVTAIVGESGSGKSSLSRLLFRLYEPTSGRILVDGKPIADMPLYLVRGWFAYISQDVVLFNDSIAYNIALANPSATAADIREAAVTAHLQDFIESLPNQYETMVGQRGLKLSGGERQRIGIARAALTKRRIFICDEPTSSLDSNTETEVMRNLLHAAQGHTTVIIAHRLSTIAHADEILVMAQGQLVERGTHETLVQRKGRYAAMWRAQTESDASQLAVLRTQRS